MTWSKLSNQEATKRIQGLVIVYKAILFKPLIFKSALASASKLRNTIVPAT